MQSVCRVCVVFSGGGGGGLCWVPGRAASSLQGRGESRCAGQDPISRIVVGGRSGEAS